MTLKVLCKVRKGRPLKWTAQACFITFLLVILNQIMGALLATDQGLDLTDEALYLLAASSEIKSASWGFPFGWNTSYLFNLAGKNISVFRSYGATLLVASSSALGWLLAHIALELRGFSQRTNRGQVSKWLAAAVLGMASLMFYGGFLRSPSYNWLAVFGALIATSGNLILLAKNLKPFRQFGPFYCWTAPLISSLGFLIALPGKPTTALIQFSMFCLVMSIVHGIREAVKQIVGVLLYGTLVTIILVYISAWPSPVSTFRRALDLPTPTNLQTIGGAIKQLETIPVGLANFIPGIQINGLMNSIAFLFAIAIFSFLFNSYRSGNSRGVMGTFITSLLTSLLIYSVIYHLRIQTPFYSWPALNRIIFAGVMPATITALVFLLCVLDFREGFLKGVTFKTPSKTDHLRFKFLGDRARNRRVIEIVCLVFYLFAIPFSVGFGSGNGLVRQSNLASASLLAILVFCIVRFAANRWLVVSLAITLVVSSLGVSSLLSDSRNGPYRMTNIASQSNELTVFENGALKVDEKTLNYALSMRRAAESAGWNKGDPLVGLDWTWPTGTALILNARPPQSLMLSLGSTATAAHNLGLPADGFKFTEAWISVTSPEALADIGGSARTITDSILGLVSERSQLQFPDHYVCVAEIESTQLWKPRGDTDKIEHAELAGCEW